MPYTITDIHVAFDGKPVLAGVSLTLPEQGVVALMGPSGCGKTTLLRVLAGLQCPDRGTALPPDTRCAFVFQEDRLLDWATALENVTLVLPPPAAAERARAELTALGLGDSLPVRAAALSGGMRRRVALARALAADAPLLLLDEPYHGLDDAVKAVAESRIRAAAERSSVLLVTHDRAEAEALDAQIILLPPKEVVI